MRLAAETLTTMLTTALLGLAGCGDSSALTTATDGSESTDASSTSPGGSETSDGSGSGSASATGSSATTSSSASASSGATSSTSASATGETGETSETGETGETGELPPTCGQPGPGAGTHTRELEVDGRAREYRLFVPSTYSGETPAPLVLNFHGLLGNPDQQADFSQFNDSAEPRGIVVAYPAGVGASFNAGACCGEAHDQDVNDVLFAREIVEDVRNELCIDRKRVYVTGMSNGGHMAHLLACRAADVFAAAASVTGVLGIAPFDCQPARPISFMDFHGTGDLIVSYNGAGPGYPSVVPMMEAWAARNGCAPASQTTFSQGDMTCEAWYGCDAGVEVELCTVEGGGHCWPGNATCLFGHSSTELHASEVIADMFLAHTLP